MSEHIKLNYGREIREWMEANAPADYAEIEKEPIDGKLYGVEHAVFTPEGDPILAVARVYIAKTAEEALQKYVHGYASQLTGKGKECVFTKNLGQYTYEMQEIEVSQIENEEYLVH